jgi:hypothetical protein
LRDGLFINGVFDGVLGEIIEVHSAFPDQPLFLQPYSNSQVSALAKAPPTADDPVPLFISTTDDLVHVRYIGEIIGWDDKRTISPAKRRVFNTLIDSFQPNEKNLYDKGVNVIVVRHVSRLEQPFPVGQLIVRSTMKPLGARTTAGGWAFVLRDPVGVSLPANVTSPMPRREDGGTLDTVAPAEWED